VLLDRVDDKLPDFLAQDVNWRDFEDPATHIAFMPLYVTDLTVEGF
jgi:hypothetical protein